MRDVSSALVTRRARRGPVCPRYREYSLCYRGWAGLTCSARTRSAGQVRPAWFRRRRDRPRGWLTVTTWTWCHRPRAWSSHPRSWGSHLQLPEGWRWCWDYWRRGPALPPLPPPPPFPEQGSLRWAEEVEVEVERPFHGVAHPREVTCRAPVSECARPRWRVRVAGPPLPRHTARPAARGQRSPDGLGMGRSLPVPSFTNAHRIQTRV